MYNAYIGIAVYYYLRLPVVGQLGAMKIRALNEPQTNLPF